MPSTTWPTLLHTSPDVAPSAEQLARQPVAAVARRAGGDEVADAGEAGERGEVRAQSHAEARHLGQAARDEAARELSPKPRPSAMPTAMAIGFLAAPQNSTPTTSSLV